MLKGIEWTLLTLLILNTILYFSYFFIKHGMGREGLCLILFESRKPKLWCLYNILNMLLSITIYNMVNINSILYKLTMLGYSLIVLTPHLTRRPKTYNIHRVGNDIVRYSMLLLCYKYDLLFVALAIFVGCNFITSKEPLALNITFLYMNIIFLALNIKIN